MSNIRWKIDLILLALLFTLAVLGMIILYSASNSNIVVLEQQGMKMIIAFAIMLCVAHIPPHYYQRWAPSFFCISCLLLATVLICGEVNQGARRWLHLGFLRFQPAELMKLALPMMLAYFFHPRSIPPTLKSLTMAVVILAVPVLLTIKQPDLGTAILIAIAGIAVIFLAGISWWWVFSLGVLGTMSIPILWHALHYYQKERVMTFLNPERDPLGSGYHIIQSKIALGSGGLTGSGYLSGTQSHLQFLPAHATDFIFAVAGEEFGLIGCSMLIFLFLAILYRCIYISVNAQSNFTRLLSGGLALSFFTSALINIGMVIGMLPVVGVPLPLVSYGGSSMLTTMISFGIIMSIHTHRKLWAS